MGRETQEREKGGKRGRRCGGCHCHRRRRCWQGRRRSERKRAPGMRELQQRERSARKGGRRHTTSCATPNHVQPAVAPPLHSVAAMPSLPPNAVKHEGSQILRGRNCSSRHSHHRWGYESPLAEPPCCRCCWVDTAANTKPSSSQNTHIEEEERISAAARVVGESCAAIRVTVLPPLKLVREGAIIRRSYCCFYSMLFCSAPASGFAIARVSAAMGIAVGVAQTTPQGKPNKPVPKIRPGRRLTSPPAQPGTPHPANRSGWLPRGNTRSPDPESRTTCSPPRGQGQFICVLASGLGHRRARPAQYIRREDSTPPRWPPPSLVRHTTNSTSLQLETKNPLCATPGSRTLIPSQSPDPSSTRDHQCGLKVTIVERYITLKIPQELIQNYQNQGYTHLHLREVRLILTLHGRRSLPVIAKVALLDTTFKEYQHALIGALVTTLSNESVILTIAHNFTIRLSDPTICQRLKIQIQLVGVIQDSNAEQAILHHQVLYRVQDYALDLNLPNTTGEALFMFTDNARGPAIVNIPRMITTDELSSIISLEWITDYEKAFLKEQRPGMTKQTSLQGPSFRRINMISPVQDVDPSMCDPDCDCANQWSDTDDKDYARRQRNKKKKKKLLQAPCSFKRPEPPDDAEAAPMLRKKPMLRKTRLSRKDSMDYLYQPVNMIPCIATLRFYEEEFPPLVTQTDEKKITRRPYVIPQGITPHGHQATNPQEKVLNWHTDNAFSQNKVLLRIDHTLDALVEKTEGLLAQLSSVAEQVAELKNWLSAQAFQLDQELKTYIDNKYFGPEFHKKNRELDQVKAQLRKIEMDKIKAAVPQVLAIDPLSMYPKPYPSYSPILFPLTYSPPETPDYDSIFKSTYHLARQANTKKSISPQGRRYSSQSQPSIQPRPHPPWKPENFFREETSFNVPTKDKGIKEGSPTPGRSINTLTLDNQSHSEETTEVSEDTTETSEETDEWSEEDYEADLLAIAIVNPVEEEEKEITSKRDEPTVSASHTHTESFEVKTSNKWFTFDDIPPARYRKRLNEFSAWIETTMANPNLSSRQVLADFINQMTGNLQEWVNNLSEYERLQLINGTSSQFLGIIHQEFLGDITIIQKRNSQEYFEMK
ncbi:polyprotein [Arachis hypogaea]|nr:polyprotein [Arachis hypogaea]